MHRVTNYNVGMPKHYCVKLEYSSFKLEQDYSNYKATFISTVPMGPRNIAF